MSPTDVCVNCGYQRGAHYPPTFPFETKSYCPRALGFGAFGPDLESKGFATEETAPETLPTPEIRARVVELTEDPVEVKKPFCKKAYYGIDCNCGQCPVKYKSL